MFEQARAVCEGDHTLSRFQNWRLFDGKWVPAVFLKADEGWRDTQGRGEWIERGAMRPRKEGEDCFPVNKQLNTADVLKKRFGQLWL
jgi:hypothetical protein